MVRRLRVVSPETAGRVRAAIAALGYQPDPALSSLAAYRARLQPGRASGNVVAFLDRDGSPYSGQVREGAEQEAARLGYRLEPFRLAPGEAVQRRLSRQLYHRGIQGLLFGPSDAAWRFVAWEWPRFAAVSLGALIHQPPMHSVAMDYFQGAFDAAEALRRQGCRRIGLALEGHLESRSGHRWIGGLQASLHPSGLPLFRAERCGDPRALREWARRHRIDGVATIHGAVWRALASRPIRFVFLNDFDCPPGVPHLTLSPESIGAEGMRCLHPLLIHREFGIPEQPKMTALQARVGALPRLP